MTIEELAERMSEQFEQVNKRFEEQDLQMNKRFEKQDLQMNKRFEKQDLQMNKRFDEQGKDIKTIKKTVRSIKKTVDVLINMEDRHTINTRKRLDRIEDHLGLPRPPMTEI